jgi:hypothetical protein
MKQISDELYSRLEFLGIICDDNTRNYNEGKSNYSQHTIQPWSIWLDWDLNPWDADIVKRVLRTKEDEPRELDYDKIIHDCKERKRQLKYESRNN